LFERHKVSIREIKQCFANRTGKFLIDNRAQHATNPPTQWFVAETDKGRWFKVIFMINQKSEFVIKSAYEPEAAAKRIYQHHYG